MSLKDNARDWIKSVIAPHLGKNIRSFKWSTYTGEIGHNQLGGVIFLQPAEGKVVEMDDRFTLIKTGPANFTVIVTSLLSDPVTVDDKVSVKFYQPRRFDGTAADGSEDASQNGSRMIMLTGVKTLFPAKWEGRYLCINSRLSEAYTEIQNPYLRDMLSQMEAMPVDSGLRYAINVLVDAGAQDLQFVDPPEANSVETPPGLTMRIVNCKFAGSLYVGYDRGTDTYFLELTPGDGSDQRRFEGIHFNELGPRLVEEIDDREWLKARVTIIKKAPKRKVQPELV